MEWKGFGRKWPEPNCGSILTFAWRENHEKPIKIAVFQPIFDPSTSQTSLECYCYTNHIRFLVVKTNTVQQ
jgi:hypothetical protein